MKLIFFNFAIHKNMNIKNIENKDNIVPKTNYYCVIDLSGSMSGNIEELKEVMMLINDRVKDGDTVSISYFSGYGEYDWICKGSTIQNNNLKNLLDSKFYARGLTCYTEVLSSLEKVVDDVGLLTGNNNSALFFLTDGYPNDHSNDNDVLNICRKIKDMFQMSIICGFGEYYSRETLSKMSDEIQGQMTHASVMLDVKTNYDSFLTLNKKTKSLYLGSKFDFVWQVTESDVFVLKQKEDLSITVLDVNSELYYTSDTSVISDDPKLVYSFVYVLSKLNKANIGVNILVKNGCLRDAEKLRKAFTVSQKGEAENYFKNKIFSSEKLDLTETKTCLTLKNFISTVQNSLGKCELYDFKYNKSTRKSEYKNNVRVSKDKKGLIVDIISNESRPNLSFLVLYKCQISEVLDDELKDKIELYNKTHENKILFPIDSVMYKNYSFISNGNFNFDYLTIDDIIYYPKEDIDIFDSDISSLSIDSFCELSKKIIKKKAHLSVINMYKKENEFKKEDKRVTLYHEDALPILEELGFDYKMRYSGKRISSKKDYKNRDFILYQCIDTYIKGSSSINAKKSYEKYLKNSTRIKLNAGDEICFKYFKRYDHRAAKSIDFLSTLSHESKKLENKINFLRNQLSSIKFYMMMTNSWFDNMDKKETNEYKDLVIKVKHEKEYI